MTISKINTVKSGFLLCSRLLGDSHFSEVNLCCVIILQRRAYPALKLDMHFFPNWLSCSGYIINRSKLHNAVYEISRNIK